MCVCVWCWSGNYKMNLKLHSSVTQKHNFITETFSLVFSSCSWALWGILQDKRGGKTDEFWIMLRICSVLNCTVYCFVCSCAIQSKWDQLVCNLLCCHVEMVNIPLSLSPSVFLRALLSQQLLSVWAVPAPKYNRVFLTASPGIDWQWRIHHGSFGAVRGRAS